MVRLKIRDSHLTCKVANKWLNVLERVEVVEWNKRYSPPFPSCPVSLQCPCKKILIEKKKIWTQGTWKEQSLRENYNTKLLWTQIIIRAYCRRTKKICMHHWLGRIWAKVIGQEVWFVPNGLGSINKNFWHI